MPFIFDTMIILLILKI